MRGQAKQLAVVLVVAAGLAGTDSAPARAGTYAVLACDAVPGVGAVNSSWGFSASPGHAPQTLCPTYGNDQRGIVTRIISDAGSGVFERATFTAPAGNSIAGLRWAGRWSRNNCRWGARIYARPSETTVTGFAANQFCSAAAAFEFPAPANQQVPAGTTALVQNVQCGASTCPAGATFNTYQATVTVFDPEMQFLSITGGSVLSPGWNRGGATVGFSAADSAGVRTIAARVNGIGRLPVTYPCSYIYATPCSNRVGSLPLDVADLPDGTHTLRLTATDAANNARSVDRTFKTDNTPPARIEPTAVGGEGWKRRNGFGVTWATPAQAHAPIVRARYLLCPPSGKNCVSSSRDGSAINSLSNLPVQQLGDNTLKVWLEDAAGNQSEALASDPVHLRLDPEAPSMAFLPQDPADPQTVAVRALDAHSGVAGGEIEIRRAGGNTWQPLATTVAAGRLTADLDDEILPDGRYEFRARAVDAAGNEASTDRLLGGARAAVNLPVRIPTGLRVGIPKTKLKRRAIRRNGRRRMVRRRVTSFVPRARVRFGRTVLLEGSLANPDGQPIDGASITVLARMDSPGAGFSPVGFIRTDARGRFSYRARGSTSRTLRFRYGGTRQIRGATRDVELLVPAPSTIRTSRSRLLNGQSVTFSGQVRGGPIPAAGKLIEIQAFFRGRWRTISTTRSDARGRWRFAYRFGATSGTVRYRFRARLPQEAGYPFATGASPLAIVTVRGL